MEPSVKTTWNDPMPGIREATRRGLREVLEKTVTEAKSLASGFAKPTGRLMNSIMYQMEGEEGGFNDGGGAKADSTEKIKEPNQELVGYVGSNVHYAIYQEAGTRWIPPHPFIRPAIAIHVQGKSAVEVMRKWARMRDKWGALKKATKDGKGPVNLGDIKESF